MKPTKQQKDTFFNKSIYAITDGIDERIIQLEVEYAKVKNLRLFLEVDVYHCLLDMIYFRDSLEVAKSMLVKNDMSESFAMEQCDHYLHLLDRIELKGFIYLMKVKDAWFSYSKVMKAKFNEMICGIGKEI